MLPRIPLLSREKPTGFPAAELLASGDEWLSQQQSDCPVPVRMLAGDFGECCHATIFHRAVGSNLNNCHGSSRNRKQYAGSAYNQNELHARMVGEHQGQAADANP